MQTSSNNSHNCLGYSNIKQVMSTALYLKPIGTDYFKGFTHTFTYVQAVSANSNGFQLLYHILELVHLRLRQAKIGINKTIIPPTYQDVTDDSIHTFLTHYKNFLIYESLINNALHYNSRPCPGLVYVKSTLQAYQHDARLNSSITFPLELEFDEIRFVLNKHSEGYNVGDKS